MTARALVQHHAKIGVRKALRVLQTEIQRRFGKDARSVIGQNTLSIAPDGIELTDHNCHIIARGHARVATVLVRKRRKAK